MAPKRASPKAPSITLTERFDYGALSYIINNFKSFQFRPGTDAKETLRMIRRYKAAACEDGTHRVEYRRAAHGHGRYFADRGLSLQCMAREIRNAIAFPFYDDLDFHNCHPTLLMQHCQRTGVCCPMLDEYCRDRDAVLASLAPSASVGKAAVLAVINGGSSDPVRRGVVPGVPWLPGFVEEMRTVRECVVGRSDLPYLELARKTGGDNLLGSALNMLLCDLENDSLMALREFVESEGVARRVGVLVFDGCMVERPTAAVSSATVSSTAAQDMLNAASDYVHERTGFRLRIVGKDMTADKLDVPLTVYGVAGMPRSPRFAEDDASAAVLFLEDVAPIARSCRGRVHVLDGVRWTSSEVMVEKLLLARCMGANIVKLSGGGDSDSYTTMSGNVPGARRIVTATKAFMPDDEGFEERMWQSNLGVVCFRNGLYDFRRAEFFEYGARPDVLPRLVIPRDFPRERPSEALLQEVRERLLLSTLGCPEVERTYLELMARAMAGEHTDKQWVVMLGERNCGKGLLQDMNMLAWGPYVNTINANSFLLQQQAAGDAAKALSWVLSCEFTRQTYTNEVKCDASSRAVKLDGNLLKSFQSGGDKMSARCNYENERELRVATKLIMNLNDVPDITPRDAVSTLVLLKFPYKFVSAEELSGEDTQPFFRLRDDKLKTEFCQRPDVADAFTWLVVDAYKAGPVVPCASVRDDTNAYREDVGDDLVIMTRCFKVTRDRSNVVTIKQLKEFLFNKNVSLTVAKERLKKMGAVENNDCCVGGVRHGRGFMCVKMLEQQVEESRPVDRYDL